MNIKFILSLPSLLNTVVLYQEFNVIHFDKLLIICIFLLAYKHKKYFPIYCYNYNNHLKKIC